jgi:hypothetical protein
MSNQISLKPCPICSTMMWVIGTDNKGKKITSCGHKFRFKQTKSQKDMGRKYVVTSWGLELAPAEKKDE